MLYTEVPFLDRYALAAEDGFEAVEFVPLRLAASEIRRLDDYGRWCCTTGDWDAGERGIACHPDRVEGIPRRRRPRHRVRPGLGVKQLNCLAGRRPPASRIARLRATFIDNLRHAASALKQAGLNR